MPRDSRAPSHYRSPTPHFSEDDDSQTITNAKISRTQGFWRNHRDPRIWSVMEPAIHSFHFLMLTGDVFGNHAIMRKYVSTAFETAFDSTGTERFEITPPMITTVSNT